MPYTVRRVAVTVIYCVLGVRITRRAWKEFRSSPENLYSTTEIVKCCKKKKKKDVESPFDSSVRRWATCAESPRPSLRIACVVRFRSINRHFIRFLRIRDSVRARTNALNVLDDIRVYRTIGAIKSGPLWKKKNRVDGFRATKTKSKLKTIDDCNGKITFFDFIV